MPADPSPRQAPPRDSTLCARAPLAPPSVSVPLVPSIDLSVVYRIASLDQIDALNEGRLKGFSYARDSHPGAVELATKIAAIEGAEAALVCASGMAAISSTLLASLNQGDHVVLSDGLYGKTTTLVAKELLRFGVTHDRFDPSRPDSLASLLTSRTRLIVAETISNPLLRVADLEAICRVAREARVPVLVDHTFAPLLCKPIELGATFVMHSVTKLIGGHSDLTAGAVAGPRESIDRIASLASTFGQTGNPFESWLALRGMATLSLRSTRASATALELAGRLESHAGVARVLYPGLRSHPDFELARRMLKTGFGAMVAFDIGGRAQADRLIRSLRHIPFAPSLGDVQTTLSHPFTTSHKGQDTAILEKMGITPGLIRLSVGLEDPEDLWEDFEQALGKGSGELRSES
jgi:cystathionine beta-lyase/cystathionine gamma-synthase